MKMKFSGLALVGTSFLHGAASLQVDGVSGIVPKLENVASDKKFFGPPFPADYPDDRQPSPGHDLKPEKRSSIYPKLAGDGFMDRDYVKDENSDGGEWEAQMAYDNARVKYQKQNQLSEAAHERMRREAKEADAAAKKAKAAEASEEAAEKAEKVAEGKEKDAADDLEHIEDLAKKAAEEASKHAEEIAKHNFTKEEIKNNVSESDKNLKAAQAAFNKAADGLKECQKNYDEANAALQKAKATHEALLKKKAEILGKNISGADLEDYSDELKIAKAKVDAAKAKAAAAAAQEKALGVKEAAAEADLKRQQGQRADAGHDAEAAEKSEDQAKKDLEEAKQRLRNIRNPPPPKSAAATVVPSALMVSILAFIAYLL